MDDDAGVTAMAMAMALAAIADAVAAEIDFYLLASDKANACVNVLYAKPYAAKHIRIPIQLYTRTHEHIRRLMPKKWRETQRKLFL